MSQDTLSQAELANKPFEAGTGISFKILDDKILICSKEETKIRQGNFLLQGREIIVEGERGIKLSSRHPNILVISQDTTKQEEAIFDMKQEMNKRLEVIEKCFAKIIKSVKQ